LAGVDFACVERALLPAAFDFALALALAFVFPFAPTVQTQNHLACTVLG
jgi:hypothetical protein